MDLGRRVLRRVRTGIAAKFGREPLEGSGSGGEQLDGVGSPQLDHKVGAGLAIAQEFRDFTAGCRGVRMTSPCHLAHVLRVTMARDRRVTML